MLYKEEIKHTILDVLKNRTSSIVSCIGALLDNGYIPNNKKYIQLGICNMLIDSYENINLFTKNQQDNIDFIYNKIIK